MNFEAILRIFVAPLGTKEDIIRTVEQVRADAQEMLQFAGEVKQEFIDGINVTQDQVYIRALPVDFFISLLNTVEAWAERTLAEIETWDDLMPSDEERKGASKRFANFPSTPQKRHSKTYPYPQRAKRGPAPDRWLSTSNLPHCPTPSHTEQSQPDVTAAVAEETDRLERIPHEVSAQQHSQPKSGPSTPGSTAHNAR